MRVGLHHALRDEVRVGVPDVLGVELGAVVVDSRAQSPCGVREVICDFATSSLPLQQSLGGALVEDRQGFSVVADAVALRGVVRALLEQCNHRELANVVFFALVTEARVEPEDQVRRVVGGRQGHDDLAVLRALFMGSRA